MLSQATASPDRSPSSRCLRGARARREHIGIPAETGLAPADAVERVGLSDLVTGELGPPVRLPRVVQRLLVPSGLLGEAARAVVRGRLIRGIAGRLEQRERGLEMVGRLRAASLLESDQGERSVRRRLRRGMPEPLGRLQRDCGRRCQSSQCRSRSRNVPIARANSQACRPCLRGRLCPLWIPLPAVLAGTRPAPRPRPSSVTGRPPARGGCGRRGAGPSFAALLRRTEVVRRVRRAGGGPPPRWRLPGLRSS